MIELFRTLTAIGARHARQELVPPSVYLDTWAIRAFSETAALGDRLRAALLRARGTLALSDINLVEFTGMSDASHAYEAGRFFDSLLPHLFLMRCDPTLVIERETDVLLQKRHQSPVGDVKALAEFAAAAAQRNGRFSASAWFHIVHSERAKLQPQLPGIARVFYAQIAQLRERMAKERGVLKLVPPEGTRPPTLALLQAIIRDLQADHRLPEDPNSAIDLVHTVVPGAYCDFVLLDRQWCVRLNNAAAKLRAVGITAKVAAGYSKQNGGIERFLEALENWSQPAVS
jgi:hypothetical protein